MCLNHVVKIFTKLKGRPKGINILSAYDRRFKTRCISILNNCVIRNHKC